MAVINITQKQLDILVNGSLESSFEQRANAANYDVSVSSGTNSTSEGNSDPLTYNNSYHICYGIIGTDSSSGTDEINEWEVTDGAGNVVGSVTASIGSGDYAGIGLTTFQNETPPLSMTLVRSDPIIEYSNTGIRAISFEGTLSTGGVTQS